VQISFIYCDSTNIRMFAQDGTPWFALPDLCGVLGIDDIKSTVKLLAEYECVAAMLPMSAGQREIVAAVNLSGFCTVVRHSRCRETAQSLKRLVMTKVAPSARLLDEPILLAPQPEEQLTSTSELADTLGLAPQTLGRRVRHLKTAGHGELRPALGRDSNRPISQWWWNSAGRAAVLREFGGTRRQRRAAR
jgi:hypothetical protein